MKILELEQYYRVPFGDGSFYFQHQGDGTVRICLTGSWLRDAKKLFGEPTGKDNHGYPVWKLKPARG